MKFMKMLALLIMAGMLVGSSCVNVRPPPVHIEPDDTPNCAAACKKLIELGCPEGQPLEDGTTCEQFCIDTQESGHPLNPTCVMGMTACSELPGCTNPTR